MTVPVPKYASRRPLYWLWKAKYRTRQLVHSYKRNPYCNEHRRYKDDTNFVGGQHRHIEPIVGNGYTFERVAADFTPFTSSDTAYSDGLALGWAWIEPEEE